MQCGYRYACQSTRLTGLEMHDPSSAQLNLHVRVQGRASKRDLSLMAVKNTCLALESEVGVRSTEYEVTKKPLYQYIICVFCGVFLERSRPVGTETCSRLEM